MLCQWVDIYVVMLVQYVLILPGHHSSCNADWTTAKFVDESADNGSGGQVDAS